MDNVPQLLKSDQYRRFLREVTNAERGFQVTSGVLCAADYGVPQLRYRAIVFGWKLDLPRLPAPSLSPDQYVTVRTALIGLPKMPNGENWHRTRPGVWPTSLRRYSAVPKNGGNRFQMQEVLDRRGLGHLVPPCWRKKQSGTTDVFGRLWWDRSSVTIRTEFHKPEKGRYLHPEMSRAITVREAARLQSFPDSFVFPEDQTMSSVARQIGNAVPPLFAKALAKAVSVQLLGESNRFAKRLIPSDRQLELVS
jgi:DNA (cytosine-5)-methyltransferase 1